MEKLKFNLNKKVIFNENDFFNSDRTCIDKTSIIGSNVQLGNNVKIGPFCVLLGNIQIDDNTKIYSHVTIGFPAQDSNTNKPLGLIEIGKNCIIREFVTISSSKLNNGKTSIGNNCYIMNYSHIAHDVILENNVIIINNVNLGGHVYIEKNAFLMANCALHQFCRIGSFTALAPFSASRQDLPPYCLFDGQPTAFKGLNIVALKRGGLSYKDINSLKHVTKLFYKDKILLNEVKVLASKEEWGQNSHVKNFLNFINNSIRGVSKRC